MKVKVLVGMMCCLLILCGCHQDIPVNKNTNSKPSNDISFSAGKKNDDEPKTEVKEETNVILEKQDSYDEPKQNNQPSVVENKPQEQAIQQNKPNPPKEPEVTSPPPKKEEPTNPIPEVIEPPKTPEVPDEPVKEVFDVGPIIDLAKEYALSIGLTLDPLATECWDNPITASVENKNALENIKGRLNRYKNIEGFTGVWIWSEKISDTDYNIYIGYY